MAKKKALAAADSAAPVERIEIPERDLRRITVPIVGLTPLIMHRWSEKAKRQMRDKQQKRAGQAKEAKDPREEAEQATYFIARKPDRYGMPIGAFDGAALDAALALNAKKTEMRRAYRIEPDAHTDDGPMVEILTDEAPLVREDMVRVGMGTADLRYRPEFRSWSCNLRIIFDARQVSAEQIVNLFIQAGFSSGIGEWRRSAPKRPGTYGSFEVARTD